MKTFVIAQHHGVFLTLESLIDCGITDPVVIIPHSQVDKYNSMYEDNRSNREFEIFKDFDKRVSKFCRDQRESGRADISVFVAENLDIRNTVSSTVSAISLYGYEGKAACLMAGTIVIKDFREVADIILDTEFAICPSRVYQKNRNLGMYHMIGLPKQDNSLDCNFFLVDMSRIVEEQLGVADSQLLSDAVARKELKELPRHFNGKDDALIGTAISARQTVQHGLKASRGYVLNFWNKAVTMYDKQKSEELFGYPYHYYSKYTKRVRSNIPATTAFRMIKNGDETERLVGGLDQCMDLIDR